MGEVAELVLEGVLCETCGILVGGPVGHPRTCKSCDSIPAPTCPKCGGEMDKDPAMNPISRRDNKTEICNACGVRESMEDMGW